MMVNILTFVKEGTMSELVKTVKLRLYADSRADALFRELTRRYADACTDISRYVFDHGFILNFMELQKHLYDSVREEHGLKSQMTISAFKTVTARYKTIQEQLKQKPYKYRVSDKKTITVSRTLEWLTKPIVFRRPQADLVRGRDYSFIQGRNLLSLNTLDKRAVVPFAHPECFGQYFDGTWSLGTGKLVEQNGIWYFHIPATKAAGSELDPHAPKHVVGIDRGLRFLATVYDEEEKTTFLSGAEVLAKRNRFADTRAHLQSKGTKSAKRALKRISGRENRWMSDVNHQISKTLVRKYGPGTLFVLEDLTGVSFSEENLSGKSNDSRRQLRSWTFYQFEQFLAYKAKENGSDILKVPADYTSQRCPKCGRIRKENRDHEHHEYVCDCCGYRSNDDRVGAMNIRMLGTMYVSGDANPRFGPRKTN